MMTIICKSPPPISPSWELPDGWLLWYWGDALDRIVEGRGHLDAVVVSLAHQKALKFGDKLRQWLCNEQLTGQSADQHFIALHAQYQRGSFTVTERPHVAALTLAKLNTRRVLHLEGIETEPQGTLRCLQVCPTHHEPHVLCATQLAISAAPTVSVSAEHPLWLGILQAELALLCPWLNTLNATLINPTAQGASPERSPSELMISRDARGLSLRSQRFNEPLILGGALQEEAWARWLTALERTSGLPLTMMNHALSSELLLEAESLLDGPTSESATPLPVIRDSLYTMNYEDAPSEYPSEDPDVELSEDPSSTLMSDFDERGVASSSPPAPVRAQPDDQRELDSVEGEDEDESSLFTDISLSDVSLSTPLLPRTAPQEERSEPEQKLHEQLKRGAPIKLSPSASFDLDALNLSESETTMSPQPYKVLPSLETLEEDEGGLNTFNELKGSPDTIYHEEREESPSELELSASSSGEGSAPTRVDLDRYMVESALAQLDDESPTTTEAPPEVTPPAQRFMQTSDYHSQGAPSSVREPPSFHGSIHEETTKVNDKEEAQPTPTEEPTRKINLNAIAEAEAEERKRSFSDVMRRFKSKP